MAKSKKKQGKSATTGVMSSKNKKAEPRTEGRGMGSEFAYAVADALEKSKHLKGSEQDFLGVRKRLIDPKDYAHSLIDNKKKK